MTNKSRVKVGIGQDSHRFSDSGQAVVAGLLFEGAPALDADSDGDVVFHSICNAITSITHVPILGGKAIELCHKEGVKDSKVFLEVALETLGNWKISHVALTIEGRKPHFQKRIDEMRKNISSVMGISLDDIGITATSGDKLTSFAKGEGLQCFCVLTVYN